ncbi:MAG: BlaI family penicillinase repressor [Chlamydiales bacterium]|jgi:BlaI family penicillinase repressor
MTRAHQLGELQLAIMQILWSADEATVAIVHRELQPERDLAHTTVATMLSKMEKKGVVAHRSEGRQFVYRATVSQAQVNRSMVSELTQRLFEGSPAALVSHLLTRSDIDPGELRRIREMIEASEEGQSPR